MSLPKPFDDSPHFYLVDKPSGVTSFDVIRKLKPILFAKLGKGKGRHKLKIGHFGTLDPFASGLLLIGSGKALKLTSYVHDDLMKSYQAIGVVGQRTLTGDRDGEVVERRERDISRGEWEQVFSHFPERYLQRPSYFSSVKHEGKPLYEYARQGIFIDKEPVERVIQNLTAQRMEPCQVEFSCTVSTGTYIRALWEDLCARAGTVGHLRELRRTSIGALKVDDAVDWDNLAKIQALTPQEVLPFPQVELSEQGAMAVRHGADVALSDDQRELLWATWQGVNFALLRKVDKGTFRPAVNFMALG